MPPMAKQNSSHALAWPTDGSVACMQCNFVLHRNSQSCGNCGLRLERSDQLLIIHTHLDDEMPTANVPARDFPPDVEIPAANSAMSNQPPQALANIYHATTLQPIVTSPTTPFKSTKTNTIAKWATRCRDDVRRAASVNPEYTSVLARFRDDAAFAANKIAWGNSQEFKQISKMVADYIEKCEAEGTQDNSIQYLGDFFDENTARAVDMAATRQKQVVNLTPEQRRALKQKQLSQGTGKQFKVVSTHSENDPHVGYSLPAEYHPAFANFAAQGNSSSSTSTDIRYRVEQLPVEHAEIPSSSTGEMNWGSEKQTSVSRSTAEKELDEMD